jgi:hypothetical protein
MSCTRPSRNAETGGTIFGSTWLVDTSLDAQGIWDRLAPHVDKSDFVLVIGVTREYQGWLPKDAWEWINSRQWKLAA